MGVIGTVLGFPFAPVRGVVTLSRLIRERVEQERRDPAAIRQELEAAEEARATGQISAEEEARIQEQATDAVIEQNPDTGKR